MWLTVRDDNEQLIREELPGPGGTVCFAVGRPDGPRSGIWAVQAPTKTRDVYIAGLGIGGLQKVSLHQSGDWRYQWTREQAAELGLPGKGRIIEQWTRPSEAVPGWTEAFQIWFPNDELTTFSGVPAPEDPYFKGVCQSEEEIVWVPAPGPGKAIGASVFLGEPDHEEVGFEGFLPIGGFELAPVAGRHEACLVLIEVRVMTASDIALIRDARARIPVDPELAELIATKPGLRAFGFAKGLRDVPCFYDFSPPDV
jgi:hypothetical protein